MMTRERNEPSVERDSAVEGVAPRQLLTTDDLDAVRHVVWTNIDAGISTWTIDDLAREASVAVEPLRSIFGRAERIVDEVVAGELRRSRPIVTHAAHDEQNATMLISELVRNRLLVDDRISPIWHLIGQGEASSQEFDALRSTLRADLGIRIESRIEHLDPHDQIEAVRIIDGALSLAAVRSLRADVNTTSDQVVARLHAHVEQLFEGFALVSPSQRSPRLIIVTRSDPES